MIRRLKFDWEVSAESAIVFTLDEVHDVVLVANQTVKLGSSESIFTALENAFHFERSTTQALMFYKVEVFIRVN